MLYRLDCFVDSAKLSRGFRLHEFLDLVGELGVAAVEERFGLTATRPALSQGYAAQTCVYQQ
jgi:hypothetical protein